MTPSSARTDPPDIAPYRELVLINGIIALVDEEDFQIVSKYRWRFQPDRNRPDVGYAFATIERGKSVYLHRLVMKATKEQLVDHKNRDRLDCRKQNLRCCSFSENASNRTITKLPGSGYIGVVKAPLDGKPYFKSIIKVDGKRVHGRRHLCPIECARDYDAMAVKYRGPFANLNFPPVSNDGAGT